MKRLPVYSLVFFLGLLSAYISNDPMQEVIDGVSSVEAKRKLIAFREGGIERPVSMDSYSKEHVLAKANALLNTPHKMGGTDEKGIDCSGLVMLAHSVCGIRLPHSSQEQARFGKVISSQANLQEGDLVFFFKSYHTSNLITHSGIYLGDGKFIHTSNSKGVIISQVDDPYYWGERYLFGTRLYE
ncbi:MAG: C40 family peptidase [Cytophagaceae bacterium]